MWLLSKVYKFAYDRMMNLPLYADSISLKQDQNEVSTNLDG